MGVDDLGHSEQDFAEISADQFESNQIDRDRVSLVKQHVVLEDGSYVFDEESAVEVGLDSTFAANFDQNLKSQNELTASGAAALPGTAGLSPTSNNLLHCLTSVGGMSLAQASMLMALVASGVGIILAALSFGVAAVAAVQSCCPQYCTA